MSINDSIGNSTLARLLRLKHCGAGVSQGVGINQEQPAKGSFAFATRTSKSGSEGLSKGKLLSSVVGLRWRFSSSSLRQSQAMRPRNRLRQSHRHSNRTDETKPAKGSVTPVMDTMRTAAPDNSAGQLGPSDIRRTRALTGQRCQNRLQIPPITLLRQNHEPDAR